MSTVLWGGRRGDLQYASREFWRRNLRVGMPTITVDSTAYMDVGLMFVVVPNRKGLVSPEQFLVDSIEGNRVAVLPAERLTA